MLLLAAIALLIGSALALACVAALLDARRRQGGKLRERMEVLHVARASAVRICAECGQTIDVGEAMVWLSRASGTSIGPSHARCLVILVTPSGLRLRPGTGEVVTGWHGSSIEIDEHLWQRWTAELGPS
jgi:hypothetical protein